MSAYISMVKNVISTTTASTTKLNWLSLLDENAWDVLFITALSLIIKWHSQLTNISSVLKSSPDGVMI